MRSMRTWILYRVFNIIFDMILTNDGMYLFHNEKRKKNRIVIFSDYTSLCSPMSENSVVRNCKEKYQKKN